MIKRIAIYAAIGVAVYAALGVASKVALALEPLVAWAVLAAILILVGRAAWSSWAARQAKPPAVAGAQQGNPAEAHEPHPAERTWAFLQGLGRPVCRALASLSPDAQAHWLGRAEALERQVLEIDRWVEVIRSWPEHQRQSMQAQVEQRLAQRNKAIMDFAQTLQAAAGHGTPGPARSATPS